MRPLGTYLLAHPGGPVWEAIVALAATLFVATVLILLIKFIKWRRKRKQTEKDYGPLK